MRKFIHSPKFRQNNFVTQIGCSMPASDQPVATQRCNLAVGGERVGVGNNTDGNGPLCRQSAAPSSAGSETSIATDFDNIGSFIFSADMIISTCTLTWGGMGART